MRDTTWRTHPKYISYELSDDGRIRSKGRWSKTWPGRWLPGTQLQLFERRGGYLGGNISINNHRINFDLHVLICEAFHGMRPTDDLEVRHLNGNNQDNRPSNLKWGTRVENAQDILRHGRNHERNKTHCRNGHEYSPANTYQAPNSPNKRHCRECGRINDINRKHRRRAAGGGGRWVQTHRQALEPAVS